MKTLNEINTLSSLLFFIYSGLIGLGIICILLFILVKIKGSGNKLRDLKKKEK